MNLLPFTMIFVVIISLSALSFFQSHVTTSLSSRYLIGYERAHLNARNQIEKAHFKEHLPPPTPKKDEQPAPKKERSEKKYVSFRERITDNSKFNIAPLIKERSILLEETFMHLIDELYGETELFKRAENDNLSARLSHAIIQSARDLPFETVDFTKITLNDPSLQKLWYKMLRGTAKYNLSTHEGWPPFSHFVAIRKKEPKAVVFRKASIPLLTSFFGKKATKAVLEREEQKYYDAPDTLSCLTQQEFDPILNEHSLTDRRPLFTYKCDSYSSEIIRHEDSESGVTAFLLNPDTR